MASAERMASVITANHNTSRAEYVNVFCNLVQFHIAHDPDGDLLDPTL
jgi:hypothetical protein